MKTGKHKKLSRKAVLFCAAFAVCLALLIGGLGYNSYRQSVEVSYNNYLKTMISVINAKIDVTSLKNVIETQDIDESYEALQIELNAVKENSDAQYIYIIYYTDGAENDTIAYAIMGYTRAEIEEELAQDDSLYYIMDSLGYIAGENDFAEDFRTSLKEAVSRGDTEVYFIDNKTEVVNTLIDSVEYVKTGYMPVRDSNGELVAVLCADISMTNIYNDQRTYLITVAIGTIAVVAIFLVVFLTIINKQIILPIKMIADSADDFVQQSHSVQKPEEFVYRATSVKTKDEIELLSGSINHMAGELISYMTDMKAMTAEQERTSAEHEVASQIRIGLYPTGYPAFPEREDFDLFAELFPTHAVGGDFYTYLLTDTDHLHLIIGSVTGKGVAMAMFAAIVTTIIKNYARLGYNPARILYETNNEISRNNEAGLSAEVFLATVNLISGKLEFAGAGDIGTLFKTSGSAFEDLPMRRGLRLGLLQNVPYFQDSMFLKQGDMIFSYTHGLPETTDEKGNVFSPEHMKEQINDITRHHARLDDVANTMKNTVDDFRGSAVQADDNTLLAFRYYGYKA